MKSINGTVNWGIIGCGDVCEVKSGPAFNKVKNSRLSAVMRRDKAKARDFANRHGVPRFYDDVSALIEDQEVNAIYVATPPSFHETYLEMAMKAGKPVYVEKPVSVDQPSCKRMIGFSNTYEQKSSVAHYRRCLPLFLKVKSLVQEGAIGKVRQVRIATLQPETSKLIAQTDQPWRQNPALSGGGLFNDLSPHQLDILLWIFGAPKEISGRSLNQSRRHTVPDVTMLEALYDDDVCMQGIWAFNVAEVASQDSCEIIGDQGMLRFAFFRKSTLEVIRNQDREILELDYPINIQHPMIDAVVKYFRGEGENPSSLEEAAIVMNMIDVGNSKFKT